MGRLGRHRVGWNPQDLELLIPGAGCWVFFHGLGRIQEWHSRSREELQATLDCPALGSEADWVSTSICPGHLWKLAFHFKIVSDFKVQLLISLFLSSTMSTVFYFYRLE